jgi:ubiquinone/menaquinone biosynthesis C-methylase UbiE
VTSFDDDIWRLVPEDAPGDPDLARFAAALPEVERALDLGAGDGRVAEALRARELVLADVSEVALERAQRRVPGATTALVAPDAALPFGDSSFDLVLCTETIEHVRDVQLFLSEARRVLRPGGTLALTTPAHGRMTGVAVLVRGFERLFDPLSPHLRFFSRASLAGLLEEMGFDIRSLDRRAGTLMVVATR